jgi:hypothetical protein
MWQGLADFGDGDLLDVGKKKFGTCWFLVLQNAWGLADSR